MRVQVNINDDLVEALDEYASAIGMSRSGLCAYFIGQGMFSIQQGIKVATDVLSDVAKEQKVQLNGQLNIDDIID